ncbi:MAG TPA: glycosyltransferase [Humisphaera sp.]|nr:glycosyltransferase [Humisphaera sp.]
MQSFSAGNWIPIALLGQRLTANLAAIGGRYPELAATLLALAPAREYFIQTSADQLLLGIPTPLGVQPLSQKLSPAGAREIVSRLYPNGNCAQPALIAGEDLGWLWNYLYQLPCDLQSAPGHRPPLFFLIGDLERLWVILHVQDWTALLADPRVRLFAGADAFDQFRQSLTQDLLCPWPRISVKVDAAIWPADVTLDQVINAAAQAMADRLSQLNRQHVVDFSDVTPQSIAARFANGELLNILGITSRYTTFLQHSMRDWLSAFNRLGHRTHLLIESADHEVPNGVNTSAVCAEFKPDLIVIIDHYRRETPGLPSQVPVVMWVQDALPNIFNRAAGAAHGSRDYALGFARLRMIQEFGYPASRYMPAIVGVNDERFAPRELSAAERKQFGCEVCFVSHASTPADGMIDAEIRRLGSPEAKRLLSAIFDRFAAIYKAGQIVTEPITIRQIIDQALIETRTGIPSEQMPALFEFFSQRINNALFRHQSLHWLAAMGVDLRLYGRGWEAHPAFARFAHGIADNASQLATIYQASAINLHISPHGAVHQRVMEGLAAGGFFLMRYCPGDVMERHFRTIWDWCKAEEISTDDALRDRATPAIVEQIEAIAQILQYDPFGPDDSFIQMLRSSEECGYLRSAAAVWDDDYDAITFGSAAQLRERVTHYLANPEDRRQRAASMRKPVLDRFTYVATSRRLIEFIAADMAIQSEQRIAA